MSPSSCSTPSLFRTVLAYFLAFSLLYSNVALAAKGGIKLAFPDAPQAQVLANQADSLQEDSSEEESAQASMQESVQDGDAAVLPPIVLGSGLSPTEFVAIPSQGWIGGSENSTADDPADNRFVVTLPAFDQTIQHAWLAYELYGVKDHNSVVRVLNDEPAQGGYLVQFQDEWSQQVEAISPAALREGDNTVRFSVPEEAPFAYQVRDLRVLVQLDDGTRLIRQISTQGDVEAATLDALYDADETTGVSLAQLRPISIEQNITQDTAWSTHERVQHVDTFCVDGNTACANAENMAAPFVELFLEAPSIIDSLDYFVDGAKGNALVSVQVRQASGWLPVDLYQQASRVNQGWNAVDLSQAGIIDGVRLHIENAKDSVQLNEVRVQGARDDVSADWAPSVIINQPVVQDVFGSVYVKGFVLPPQHTLLEEASVVVNGQTLSVVNGSFDGVITSNGVNTALSLQVFNKQGGLLAQQSVALAGAITADWQREYIAPDAGTVVDDSTAEQTVDHEDASLAIEEDTFEPDTQLQLRALRADDLPALAPGMVNVTKGPHKGYRFLPHGQFKRHLKVNIPYDKAKLPKGTQEKDINTYYFDEQTGRWFALEKIETDTAKGSIASRSNHFTDMINAVIQVPDSPEANGFSPTQMKDIKAADPGAEIHLIETPQVSNKGDANLVYPLHLPNGRKGLQPQLSIQYSSGSGNGWVGHGWNVNVPSVDIDTRWGVPQYDASLETESYNISGQALLPLVHRDALKPREAEKTFHPRVEGGFQRIVRHGDSPQNYWWQVTDKNGTTHYYGGNASGNVVNSAVLKDDAGNIAHWALVQTRDTHNNTVNYHYTTVNDSGIGNGQGGVEGRQLYVSHIDYTGHNNSAGAYRVDFIRDRQLGEARRADVNISGRLGFKRVTADTLRKITVSYQNNPVRSYELSYKTGAFYKTLLTDIQQFDANGQLFNTHSLDYFDEVSSSPSTYTPYTNISPWQTADDSLRAGFVLPNVGSFEDTSSALSGTDGQSRSNDLYLGFGPWDGKLFATTTTVGFRRSSGRSESEGLVALVDIDGDGLADKVMRKGGLSYRKNLSGPTGQAVFSDIKPIIGMSEFSQEDSKSSSTSVEVHIESFMVGVSRSKSTAVGKVYFSDANADGLIDIVVNGTVHFNRLVNGVPTFTSAHSNTENPVGASAPIDGDALVSVDPQELEEAIDDHPLHDTVRFWQAPESGVVEVIAPVALIDNDSDERQSYTSADGVTVSIQHKEVVLWQQRIEADDDTEQVPAGVDAIAVQAGDRIYFRVQSVFDGAYDQVSWNPDIRYTDKGDIAAQTPEMTDVNQLPKYQYQASADFLLYSLAGQPMPAGVDGTVRITGDIEKATTTDGVTAWLIKRDVSGNETVLLDYALDAGAGTLAIDEVVSVVVGETIEARLSSDTEIDWRQVQWLPQMAYMDGQDPDGNAIDMIDANGESRVIVSGAPSATLYTQQLSTQTWQADTAAIIELTPELSSAAANTVSGDVTFSIKSQGQLLHKQILQVSGSQVSAANTVTLTVDPAEHYYIEYHTANSTLAGALGANVLINTTHQANAQNELVALTVPEQQALEQTITADAYTVENNYLFGSMYREWGHFVYNGNRERADQPIVEADLQLDAELLNSNISLPDTSDPLQLTEMNLYDPAKATVVMLRVDGAKQAWVGYDDLSYLSADTMSSSRLGEDDITPLDPMAGMDVSSSTSVDTVRAINRVTKSKETRVSGGGSFAGVGANGSGSYSQTVDSENKTLTDYTDMNGDRYPDIFSQGNIQYTQGTGGLGGKVASIGGDWRRSESDTKGISTGGQITVDVNSEGKVAGTSDSVSLGGNVSEANTHTEYMFSDINGDGLQDKVYDNGTLQLNLGYRFATAEPWSILNTGDTDTQSAGVNFGFSLWSRSIAGGISLSRSDNTLENQLQDVNGDGLTDLVTASGQLYLNTGNAFVPVSWPGLSLSENKTVSEAANISVTFCLPLIPPFIVVKLCTNPGTSRSNSMGKGDTQISDLNGDGYPEVIRSKDEADMRVAFSTIGKTHLLKTVKRPLGATISLDYTRTGNTYANPSSQWVLSHVTTHDGHSGDGADVQTQRISYQNGYYDRREREFYGFDTVVINQLDTQNNNSVYRTITQQYGNAHYYNKGLLLSERLSDGNGNPYTHTVHTYQLKDITSGGILTEAGQQSDTAYVFPERISTDTYFYEGNAQASKQTRMEYGYDALGNVTRYKDLGDTGSEDDLIATIAYHNNTQAYIVALPQQITVTNSQGTVLRKRSTDIDARGNVTTLTQYNGSTPSEYRFGYDTYGNISQVTRPQNHRGQRYQISYQYDGSVNTYTTQVSDSFGYSNQSVYDLQWGKPISNTDTNEQTISYTYDAKGRATSITGPLQQGTGQATLTMAYHPKTQNNHSTSWALTQHIDKPSDPIETVLFIDGLRRVLQTKKDIDVAQGNSSQTQPKMQVSGKVIYDALGRSTAQFYPIVEALGQQGTFNTQVDSIAPTQSQYDVLDRTILTTLPDGNQMTTQHGFDADKGGEVQFHTVNIDANGNRQDTFTNVRQLITAVLNRNPSGAQPTIWTTYQYNAINELTHVEDDKGNVTQVSYDRLGRKTHINSPDMGNTQYQYDAASNVIQKITANLAQSNQAITYSYDYNRLSTITYPTNSDSNISYQYGAPGADYYSAGRIIQITDRAGYEQRQYGKLGELTQSTRMMITQTTGAQNIYKTNYEYDTWNRLQSLTYPDGETLSYQYDRGGKLISIHGKKGGDDYAYVNHITYDKFEQRAYLQYGNGTETQYRYEPERRRLSNLQSNNSSRTFMDINYQYDAMNNILAQSNSAAVATGSGLYGGASSGTYQYDNLYRLTQANGTWQNHQGHQHQYQLNFAYDTIHNIQNKNQLHERQGASGEAYTEQKKTSYDFDYSYNAAQPHAASQIGERLFSYDANGNQTGWTSTQNSTRRNIIWDEENRIRTLTDNGNNTSHYLYDHSNTRIIKTGEQGETHYINNYFVIRDGSVASKHIFVGSQRVATKLMEDKPQVVDPDPLPEVSTTDTSETTGTTDTTEADTPVVASVSPMTAAEIACTTPNGKGNAYGRCKEKNDNGNSGNTGGNGGNGGNTGNGHDGNVSGPQKGADKYEQKLYFYHPDHLGSSGYITDIHGAMYEHTQYFPTGELLAQQHSRTELVPYLFTGKELDESTGLYYYGARYYDPRTSVWQSPDPILGEYLNGSVNGGVFNSHNLGLYTYSYQNPINYFDPDGNWSAKAHDKLINHAFKDKLTKNEIKIIQKSSRDFDKRTQASNQSHMHSMAQKSESSKDAISARDKFIDKTIGEARAELHAGAKGREGALVKLGEALHPIMDSSSPSHTDADGNPKVWDFDPFSLSTYDVLGEHSPTDFMGDETSKHITPEIYKSQKILLNDAYDRVFGKQRLDEK